jgi:hypothetical protein
MLKIFFAILFLISVSCSSENCDEKLDYFHKALNDRKSWAVSVFDTWAKLESSVLRGNLVIPGGFNDCVNFRHESNETKVGTFQGKHCMMRVKSKITAASTVEFDWRGT